jgi:hypothetical protein
VRYSISGAAFNSVICHCIDCRKSSGAPAFAWFNVHVSDLRWIVGTIRQFASSDRAVRGFCARCGTTLTFFDQAWPDVIDIATASLDDPTMVPPQAHLYAASRLAWINVDDELPKFAGARSGN